MLPALVPALNALAWGGDVVLQAPSLTWRDGSGTGRLDATWRRARVIAAGFALDLGTVTMSAAPAGGAVAGTIRNSGGDVAIEGTVDDRAGVVDVALTLTPTSTAPEAVRRMLLLVGPSDGAGGVRMTWRSRR